MFGMKPITGTMVDSLLFSASLLGNFTFIFDFHSCETAVLEKVLYFGFINC